MKTTTKKSNVNKPVKAVKVTETVTKPPMVLTFHSPETPIKDKKRATVVGIVNEKESTIDIGVATC